ncbi:MAG TPA: MFS transporter [Capsulimonadaceae bacterium]|nr:MFS transporter [Capsulimonadaceae bacterium]
MSISAPNSPNSSRQINLYFTVVTFTFGIVGPLAGLPVQFYQKDQLHLGPEAVAVFNCITSIPLYVGFLFGYLRDRWRPTVWGDRAYILGSALLSAVGYFLLREGQISYAKLLIVMLFVTALAQMIQAVIQAVSTIVAQKDQATGRLSAIYWLASMLPGAITSVIGGWLSGHVPPKETFLLVGVASIAVGLLALWRPAAVYDQVAEHHSERHTAWVDIVHLIRHRPIWPAVAINGIWNFGLCFGTAAFFYLTSHNHDPSRPHLDDTQYGIWMGLQYAAFLPTAALYAWISRHWSLRRLLWIGTPFAALQGLFFLVLHTVFEAYLASIAYGIVAGVASTVFWDLLMRSAPKGLEGSAMMLGNAVANTCAMISGLYGAYLYSHGAFVASVWANTVIYLFMIPMLLLVPRWVTSGRDAETEPVIAPPLPAEPTGSPAQ